MEIQKSVGRQIRMYRKKRGLTLEALAAKIYKSKSIVSKYELGQANIDIATLYEIAQVLNIDIKALLDMPEIAPPAVQADRHSIFAESPLYLYIMEQHHKKKTVHRGIFTFQTEPDGRTSVILYMGVPDGGSYEQCNDIYKGQLFCSPYTALVFLTNSLQPADHLVIMASITRACQNMCPGFYCGFTMLDNLPYSTNAVLSKIPLLENEILQDVLEFSKEKNILLRHGNVLTGNAYIDEDALTSLKKKF